MKLTVRSVYLLLGTAFWFVLFSPDIVCYARHSGSAGQNKEQSESASLKLEDKEQIYELLRLKDKIGDSIWPGFKNAEIPLVLYNRDYEFLFFHSAPPDEWIRVEGDTIRGLPYYKKKAVFSQAFAKQIGSLWAGCLDTFTYMNVSLEKLVYENIAPEKITPVLLAMMKFNRAQHVVVLMHEVFHAFQATYNFERFQDSLSLYSQEKDFPYTNLAFKEAWNQEGLYLLEALRAKEEQKIRASVDNFVTARFQRRKEHRMSPALVLFEQGLEWLEGLAKYAEMRSAELGSEEKHSKNFKEYRVARGRLRADFYTRLRSLGDQKSDLRFYLSGAAQALLLDRLVPDWKTELHSNNNIALESLLIFKR